MIDLHNERSLRKESTRTNLNGAPDCDDASPRKKAPLLKLDGTPDRDRPRGRGSGGDGGGASDSYLRDT